MKIAESAQPLLVHGALQKILHRPYLEMPREALTFTGYGTSSTV